MSDESQHDVALPLWRVSIQYLELVQNVAREIAIQGNKSVVVVRDSAEGIIEEAELHEKTKWSDHSLGIPLLFNLYHGIELLVKGFLITAGVSVQPKHNIPTQCRQFAESYKEETQLIGFLRKYTDETELPEVIQEFLIDNNLTIDKLYPALRYPVDQDFKNATDYTALKHRGTDGVPFFKDLVNDIDCARIAAVKLGRSLLPNG